MSVNNQESADKIAELRSELTKLDAQKKTLETEAEAIVQELTSSGENGEPPMGIDSPLVDREGFPRGDIDLYRARSLRKRFHEIQTDHKLLIKKIEEGLVRMNKLKNPSVKYPDIEEEHGKVASKPKLKFDKATGKWILNGGDELKDCYSANPNDPSLNSSADSSFSTNTNLTTQTFSSVQVPFAVIDAVAPDSPASEANLCNGDLITQFGSINYLNHRNLQALMEAVHDASEKKKPIEITVLRRRRMSVEHDIPHLVEAGVRVSRTVEIIPRPWGGRGLLGCHIVGYANEESEASYEEPTLDH